MLDVMTNNPNQTIHAGGNEASGNEVTSGAETGNLPVALYGRKYGGSSNVRNANNPDTAQRLSQLVILHGLFGSSANWRSIAARLSPRREVFCLDLRNHGQSPWQDDMKYAAMGADVARFITDHRLHRPSLLGHSMGGKIAMTLAQNQSIELAKLIVVDIAPIAYSPDHHRELIDAMARVDLATAIDRRQIDAALAASIPDLAVRQFLAQNLIPAVHGHDGYRWRINLPAIAENIATLAGYPNEQVATGPTLFVAGADSDYIQLDEAGGHAAIHRSFPAASIATIQNAGHWLHAEQPDQLVALCEAFLDG